MGSSLGGYYAAYFASIYNSKAILINPAIPPLKDFDIHLGENENYSTGNKFKLTKEDMKFIRSIAFKKYDNSSNTLILLESKDTFLVGSIAVGRILFSLLPTTPSFFNSYFVFEVSALVVGIFLIYMSKKLN